MSRHRRRQITQKITNGVLIGVFSLGVAWFMTRQPQGGAFSIPQTRQTAPRTAAVNNTNANTSGAGSVGYRLNAGPYAVTEAPDITLHDAKRNRDVHVSVLYPNEAGRYPVIIHSGNAACCDGQLRHWSTYGYVTIQVQAGDDPGMHRDNRAIKNGTIENVAIEKVQLRRGKPRGPATNPVWENYPLDVSFVIDSLAELQNDLPQLRRKPDAEHIGVAGQGTGAFAAEVIAGALIDLPGHPRSNLADPRVRAILCVPPQGPGRFGLTERSFEQLVLPFLGMAAPRAGNPTVNSVASHRAPFERSQTGDKYELSVQEIDPGVIRKNVASGTGSEPVSGEFDSLDNYTGSAALAFWDAYLKHDLVARRYLQSDTLERSSHGAVKLERR